MTDKIFLVPPLTQQDNVWMYCNYARTAPYEERCLNCDDVKCKHQGEHTVINKTRR